MCNSAVQTCDATCVRCRVPKLPCVVVVVGMVARGRNRPVSWVVALWCLVAAARAFDTDVEVHRAFTPPTARTPSVGAVHSRLPGRYYGAYTAHVALVPHPAGAVALLQPPNGCGSGTIATPQQSAEAAGEDCIVATNGGFFDPDVNSSHACLGSLISEGQWIAETTAQVPSFALRRQREPQRPHAGAVDIVVGYVNATHAHEWDVLQLTTGLGWLVRRGESYIDTAFRVENWTMQRTGSAWRFRQVKAPRLAIGHDAIGRVLVVAVDGDEPLYEGVDLDDFARILVDDFGLINAVNLDGGSSVSMFVNGTVANAPSADCDGGGGLPRGPRYRCARPVGSTLCIRRRPRGLVTSTRTLSRSAPATHSAELSVSPTSAASRSRSVRATRSLAGSSTMNHTASATASASVSLPVRQRRQRRAVAAADVWKLVLLVAAPMLVAYVAVAACLRAPRVPHT